MVFITIMASVAESPVVGSSSMRRDGEVTSSMPMHSRLSSPPLMPRLDMPPTWQKGRKERKERKGERLVRRMVMK
jgi:hypothetical protein